MKRVILNYGPPDARGDGKTFKVTPMDRAPARPEHAYQEVERLESPPPKDPALIGSVLFDLPLNGAWSDLTASFDLIRVKEGLALRLDDLHVL